MDKHLLLLANSKKLRGRCLAGVEVELDGENWRFKFDAQDRPIWLRPVSRNEHGEIDHHVADPLRVMEIIRLVSTTPAPFGYQRENIHFDRLESCGMDHFEIDDLGFISVSSEAPTFGNRKNAVHVDHIDAVDHSLVLVEPSRFESYVRTYEGGKNQLRGHYTLADVEYDQSITDPGFQLGDEQGLHAYLTISLGLEHESFHSKLIAAVVLA